MKRAFARLSAKVYVPMQGPSELGASGKPVNWDRTADLSEIAVPTLDDPMSQPMITSSIIDVSNP